MASLNKVMLIGNAGKDCDLRYMANGTAKAEFSLAVNNRRRTASGETEDQTEWFNIVLFAETAERLAQYITKGKPLYIEGRLQTRSWENDAGVKQYRTEVVANGVQLLGQREDGRDRSGDPEYVPAAGSSPIRDAQRYNDRVEKNAARPASNNPDDRDVGTGSGGVFGTPTNAFDDIDDLPFQ